MPEPFTARNARSARGGGARHRTAAVAFALLAPFAAKAAEFPPGTMAGWSEKAFSGRTDYRIARLDGRDALHATCADGASGLFYEQPIDLDATPILEWSWRVPDRGDSPADETSRAGDDFAARVYVVKDGGLLRWRTRAINYVWTRSLPEGSHWPNPFLEQAHMVALRSGGSNGWVTERRDIRQDFLTFHGEEPGSIDAIAIMTDCDNVGAEAKAWYGTIRLLPAD